MNGIVPVHTSADDNEQMSLRFITMHEPAPEPPGQPRQTRTRTKFYVLTVRPWVTWTCIHWPSDWDKHFYLR